MTEWPIALTVGILIALLQGIYLGRDKDEGLPYNVALSSYIGEYALIVVSIVAMGILRDGRASKIPGWLQNDQAHVIILVGSVFIGVVASVTTLRSRWGQATDIYHDVIVAPVLLYLMVTLLPVIELNGTDGEFWATFCLVMLWVYTVAFDVKHDRMKQRGWLSIRGVLSKRLMEFRR